MTVRRDLEQLAGDGRRAQGARRRGARRPGRLRAGLRREEPARPAGQAGHRRARRRPDPARRRDRAVGRHDHLGDGPHVAAIAGLTVVTNSTTVADVITALDTANRVTVILTGGVRTPSAALVGPVADRTIASMHVDQLFLGVHGMDAARRLHHAEPGRGHHQPGARRQRPRGHRAGRLVEVGRRSGSPTSRRSSAASTVITDDALPDDARRALADPVEHRRHRRRSRPRPPSDRPTRHPPGRRAGAVLLRPARRARTAPAARPAHRPARRRRRPRRCAGTRCSATTR